MRLGGPLVGDGQQSGQVAQCEPGPVGEQVEDPLLGGLEQGGQHVLGDASSGAAVVDVRGHGDPHQGPLGGQRAPAVDPVYGVPQADGGVVGGQPPHRVVGGRRRSLPFQGEDCRRGPSAQDPAGVAQPHLVGDDEQDASGPRPVLETPEALREAGPVGGGALPDDGHGAPSGEDDGRVHRHGAIPAEADGVVDVGDG